MNFKYYFFLLLLTALLIFSCGKKEETNQTTPNTNIPVDTVKPKTTVQDTTPAIDPKIEGKRIEEATLKISGFLKIYSKFDKSKQSDIDRTYIFDSYDINNDGKFEYLVGLTGPFYCGNAGCTMLVLNSDFTLNSEIAVVNYPVFVSGSELNKGWKNIYINTGGGFHILKYDGMKYPANPGDEPEYNVSNDTSRKELLKDKMGRRRSF